MKRSFEGTCYHIKLYIYDFKVADLSSFFFFYMFRTQPLKKNLFLICQKFIPKTWIKVKKWGRNVSGQGID